MKPVTFAKLFKVKIEKSWMFNGSSIVCGSLCLV
jgi:hypothetical protein